MSALNDGEQQQQRPDHEWMEIGQRFGGSFFVEEPGGREDEEKGGDECVAEKQVPGRGLKAGPEPEMIEAGGVFDAGPEDGGKNGRERERPESNGG